MRCIACGRVVLVLALAYSICLAEEVKVELSHVVLANVEAVLAKSDFVNDKGLPVVFYSGMIIPRLRLGFSKEEPARTLELGGEKYTLVFDGVRDFGLKAGAGLAVIRRLRSGLEPLTLKPGGRQYTLATPRSLTYLDKGAMWCRSGAAQTGTVGEEVVSLYDDNIDGFYAVKGDAIRVGPVGAANCFAPIGEYVPTKTGLYRIKGIAKDGSSVSLTKVKGDTGKLVVRYPIAGVEGHFAVSSEDGKISFGVTAGEEPVVVLPGKYVLLYGFLYDAKAGNVLLLVLPGAMQPVEVVKAGEKPAVMSLGEGVHFAFDCQYRHDAGTLKVAVSGSALRGKAGEQYVGVGYDVRASASQGRVSDLIGTLSVAEDGARREHLCRMPMVQGKPMQGQVQLTLEGSVPGLGRVRGQVQMTGLDEFRDQLVAALPGVAEAERCSLLRALGGLGGQTAFEAVCRELKSASVVVRNAALQTLVDWPDASAADVLLAVARETSENEQRSVALRGCIRAIGLPAERSAAETARKYEEAMALARTANEKKLVLVGLATVPDPAALKLIAPHMKDEELRGEAEDAYLKAAVCMSGRHRETAMAALREIIAATADENRRRAAQNALTQLERENPATDTERDKK